MSARKTDPFATRPRQLRLCIESNNATDIELHVHTYAVGVGDIAAREGSPHNVLHSSSLYYHALLADHQRCSGR